jgi:glucose/arabinose dehydrogenase
MKHLILLIVVMAGAAAHAQQQPANCLKLKKVKLPQHVLHQRTQVLAEVTLKVKNCHIVEDHQQTTVTFESKPGLDVTLDEVAFRRPKDAGVGESSTNVKEVVLLLTLAASPDFPVGKTTLHGMLTYQAVGNGGAVAPETVALDVPVKVAPLPQEKPLTERNGFMKGLEVVGEIVVGIIILPILLIYCPLSGQCPSC